MLDHRCPNLNLCLGIPHNKRMWSLTYGTVMASYATLLLLAIFWFHDVFLGQRLNSSDTSVFACTLRLCDKILLKPLMFLGTNAFLFFVFSDSGGTTCLMVSSVVANRKLNHSLMYFYKKDILLSIFRCDQFNAYMDKNLAGNPQAICDSLPYAGDGACPMIMVYALIEIACWIVICYYLYSIKWFWKV